MENLRIFRGRYIVGTLTNNANINYIVLLRALLPFHRLQNGMTLNRHFALNSVCAGIFGALKHGFRSLATVKLVVNVVGEL